MANVPPGAAGIAPGIATGNTYPQYGVGGGSPGSSAGWKIVEAKTAAQKNGYIGQGYDVWFQTQAAAQSFLGTEENPYESGEPQNAIPGLAQVGDFFGALTQANTWIRAAKIIAGAVLLLTGIAHLTGASGAIMDTARKVPLPV